MKRERILGRATGRGHSQSFDTAEGEPDEREQSVRRRSDHGGGAFLVDRYVYRQGGETSAQLNEGTIRPQPDPTNVRPISVICTKHRFRNVYGKKLGWRRHGRS